jgi:RNA methyltransferase, TrmH family
LTSGLLGGRHPKVQRLRALNRDRAARATEHAFVLEGPRLVAAALDRDAPLEGAYLAYGARPAFGPLLARLDTAGVPVTDLREGVLEKIGVTRTPQPVLAVAPIPPASPVVLDRAGDVIVAVDVADPGNLGTMLRSAEAAGVRTVVVAGDSVDVYNPKVVRASAGAVLGLDVLERRDAPAAVDAARTSGRRTVGTVTRGGHPLETLDPTVPIALVLGNEARGVDPSVAAHLDTVVTIPMHPPAESLNVAMAATVVLFERDRQRRAHPFDRQGER